MIWLQAALLLFMATLATVAIAMFTNRYQLPYNSEGRFFNEKKGIEYLQQDVQTYGIVAIGLTLIATVVLAWMIETIRNTREEE